MADTLTDQAREELIATVRTGLSAWNGHSVVEAEKALDRLAAEYVRLRADLKKYGAHRHGCASTATAGGMFSPGPCTCGLGAALAGEDTPA